MTSLSRLAPQATRVLLTLVAFVFSACSEGSGLAFMESGDKPDRLNATAVPLQGQDQQGQVGSFLPSPLTVEIKDGAGMPMRGMQATWTFSAGGGAESGSVSPGQVSQSLVTTTDNQGRTSVIWRLGTLAGGQEATVKISTQSNGKGKTVDVTLDAIALPGPPQQLVLDPPRLLVAVRGQKQVNAIAADQYGNALAPGTLTWNTSDAAVATVDASGKVTGQKVGHATISATRESMSAAAAVDVQDAAAATSISVAGGNGQTGSAGQNLAVAPSVRVTDANGNAVGAAAVSWTVTSGGGSVGASPTQTDASGLASVQWTLGGSTGEQTMSASLANGAKVQFLASAGQVVVTNPATVNDLTVVGVTSNSVTVRWTQVGDGAGSPADYALRFGSPSLEWTEAAGTEVAVKGTAVGATLEHTWTGLTGNAAYQFGLVAVRNTTRGQLSNQVSAFTAPTASSGVSVASVVASPGSVYLEGAGRTQQLSATARDASGNIVSGVAFNWQSLNPAVASVNSSGLVTSQSIGTARIVVTALCCLAADTVTVTVAQAQAPSTGTPIFQDSFDSGAKAGEQNGTHWAPASHGPPDDVLVSNKIARSGSYSLEFFFGGNADKCDDAWAEQRFALGSGVDEMWVEYYIYMPDGTEGVGARYEHRVPTCSTNDPNGVVSNNKFFMMWGETYQPNDIKALFETRATSGGDAYVYALAGNDTQTSRSWGTPWKPAITNALRGKWTQIRIHLKVATSKSASDGVIELWADGVKRISINDAPLATEPGGVTYFRNGYVLGWANSGYDRNTSLFVDDFKIWTGRPGW